MPYSWTVSPINPAFNELHLWPHQSLTPKGFAAFIQITFCFALIPLVPLLGSPIFWSFLPFLIAMIAAIWIALRHSNRNFQIVEVLTLSPHKARLRRQNPSGEIQEWTCNRYWVRTNMHKTRGPVPHYITLTGNGREVEIGTFLSEEERLRLYEELTRTLAPPNQLKLRRDDS
ncbi:MAG: DUF2244 domain-containing protein [Aestuariivita sp.]|nr:DUF2244 domain-containing protein [Aestuariivita sp.]